MNAAMTKAQLLTENITLRAQYEVLLAKYESATLPVREVIATNAAVEDLIARGMPRMFSNGRQVQPTAKQVAYWSARLSH